jgi:hypothetical protein
MTSNSKRKSSVNALVAIFRSKAGKLPTQLGLTYLNLIPTVVMTMTTTTMMMMIMMMMIMMIIMIIIIIIIIIQTHYTVDHNKEYLL